VAAVTGFHRRSEPARAGSSRETAGGPVITGVIQAAAGAGGPSDPDRLVLISARRYWTRRAECTASAATSGIVYGGRTVRVVQAKPNPVPIIGMQHPLSL
jgi:hypothetical protein